MTENDDTPKAPEPVPAIDADALADATTIEAILAAVEIPATETHIRSGILSIDKAERPPKGESSD